MIEKITIAITSGLIGGVISPFIVSWLQHNIIWKSQKKAEIKQECFNKGVKALSLYFTDALDLKLQSEKPTYEGATKKVQLRPETEEHLEEARLMIKAFFSEKAFNIFDKAERTEISIENIPNTEFDKNCTNAIFALFDEL